RSMRAQPTNSLVVCVGLLLHAVHVFGGNQCDEKYEERICALNGRERRAEGIRTDIIRETTQEMQNLDKELTEYYDTIARAPLLASHPKLLGILTAGIDFPLRSYHEFKHLQHASTFQLARNQLIEKEFLAFVAIENGFERILHSARTLRKDVRTMLASTTLEKWLEWRALLEEDFRVFEAQNAAAMSGEAELGDGMAMFRELQFALDNSNYANLPIIVRRHLHFFMDQHKIDLDNHMKLIQGVEKYVQDVVGALRAMAGKCQLDELRIFKTHDCARNRATASRYLTVVIDLTSSYDHVADRYVKKICANMPSVAMVIADKSSLESFERIYEEVANVTRSVSASFKEKMKTRSSARAQLIKDAACYQYIASTGDIRKYCNSKFQL
uniref:Uncharacterized protein n=1 Tax=Parascaris univalens TaxID=6257 RepID=A0A914ZM04_PARUN